METKHKVVTHTAIFPDKTAAEAAFDDALKRGYTKGEINVLMSPETKKKFFTTEVVTGDKSMEGLAMGGALGGTVVGVLSAVVALATTITIPPLGLVVAGPLAAGLMGAGAGSIAGGLIGALVGAGIPEDRATIYERGIKKGGVVISVKSRTGDTDKELLEDWRNHNGTEIF